MKLYNTLTRSIENFTPLQDNLVRIYSCGPTVYDHAHIGNLSAYIFADTLRRALQVTGHRVKHVMNYTDVDDKTIRRSHQRYPDQDPKTALRQLTDEYIHVFLHDMQRIGNDTNVLAFMRATDTIDDIKTLITDLFKGNFAYIADDGIYFSIDAYKNAGYTYGQLSTINANRTAEARIANDEYDKESVHDFALWKKQKNNDPAWEFTLDGQYMHGRPGWHIECSVMSRKGVGQPFDIHTGGVDLIFPHHENEIAQSTALAADRRMAAFFCHNEHVLVDGKKMSKSLDNFYTLDDIIEKNYDPEAFRLFILQSHYRSQAHFSWQNLEAAQNSLKSIRQNISWTRQVATATLNEMHADLPEQSLEQQYTHTITSALADDLDTPRAIAQLHEYSNRLADQAPAQISMPAVQEFADFVQQALGLTIIDTRVINPEQQQLINRREQARQHKDWTQADKLRQQLAAQGIGIRDTESGTIWYWL